MLKETITLEGLGHFTFYNNKKMMGFNQVCLIRCLDRRSTIIYLFISLWIFEFRSDRDLRDRTCHQGLVYIFLNVIYFTFLIVQIKYSILLLFCLKSSKQNGIGQFLLRRNINKQKNNWNCSRLVKRIHYLCNDQRRSNKAMNLIELSKKNRISGSQISLNEVILVKSSTEFKLKRLNTRRV